MSKLILYNGLKADLKTVTYTKQNGQTAAIKTVGLYRNMPERTENSFLYPAVWIEFLPSTYSDLLKGVQQYDLTVRLHIQFESYKDEDVDILTLVEAVYNKVHKKQYEYFGQLLRRAETEQYDFDMVQDYMQDYQTLGKDYGADKRAVTPATVTTLAITPDITNTLP